MMDPLKKRKIRFSEELDLLLLREVLGQNPFEDHSRWTLVQQALQDVVDLEISVRTLKDRLTLLLNVWFTKNQKNEKKSGIEEAISEKDSLLQSIYDLKKEFILRNPTINKKNIIQKGKESREKAVKNIFISEQPPDTNETLEASSNLIEIIHIETEPFPEETNPEPWTEPDILDAVEDDINMATTPNNVRTFPKAGSVIDDETNKVVTTARKQTQRTETPSRKRLAQANIIGPSRKRGRGHSAGIDYLKQRSENEVKIRERELILEENKLKLEESKIVLENEKLSLERKRLNIEEEKLILVRERQEMELKERQSKLEQDGQMLKAHMSLVENQQKLLEKILEKM